MKDQSLWSDDMVDGQAEAGLVECERCGQKVNADKAVFAMVGVVEKNLCKECAAKLAVYDDDDQIYRAQTSKPVPAAVARAEAYKAQMKAKGLLVQYPRK